MGSPIDPTKMDLDQLGTLISRYQERRLTHEPIYAAFVAEYDRKASPDLKMDTTISAIREAARHRTFISYGRVAEANGIQWAKVRRKMPKHLDAVL